MKVIVQRVKEAKVEVEQKTVGSINQGLLVFLGIHKDDQPEICSWFVNKLINLRCFADSNDKMNLSLLDTKGELLVVSQFTLYANCNSGRRPDFIDAAGPEIAEKIYQKFLIEARKSIEKVQEGIFGAKMKVSLTNDGPVTFIIEN